MRRNLARAAVTGAIAAVAFAAAVTRAPSVVAAIPGLALVGAPGYVWATVLFGGRVAGLEKLMAAAGLALLVPVLGGLALYAAGVPLHATAWAALLGGVTLAGDGVLLIQGWRAPAEIPDRPLWRPGTPAWSVAAYAAAAVLAMGALGMASAGTRMQHYPGFTQLWMVPRQGQASTAAIGVSNHQGATTRYQLVLLRGGYVTDTWEITLASGKTWQSAVAWTSRADFTADLYRLPDITHPYRHVTVNGANAPGL